MDNDEDNGALGGVVLPPTPGDLGHGPDVAQPPARASLHHTVMQDLADSDTLSMWQMIT